MRIYSDKLAHIQVVINFRYSVAQICTREDAITYNLGAPRIDDVMSYNSLTSIAPFRIVLPSSVVNAGIKTIRFKSFVGQFRPTQF